MRLSPFARDLGERAAKTLGGAFATYLFEAWLGLAHLQLELRALVFAGGTAMFSAAFSLLSRWFGRRGTASLTREVVYADGPTATA